MPHCSQRYHLTCFCFVVLPCQVVLLKQCSLWQPPLKGKAGQARKLFAATARAMAPSLWAAVLLYSTWSLEEEEWRIGITKWLLGVGLDIFQSILYSEAPHLLGLQGPQQTPAYMEIPYWYTMLAYQKPSSNLLPPSANSEVSSWIGRVHDSGGSFNRDVAFHVLRSPGVEPGSPRMLSRHATSELRCSLRRQQFHFCPSSTN